MIGKKIKNPKKSASKTERIKKLTDYIRQPERENANEKCIYANAIGFLSDEPHSQTGEMIALSSEAVRSKDTINHYVLSWQDGEQPTPAQIDEAIDILLKEFGLEGHQTIYALHADTDNIHCHVVINRVHPETLKCVEINKGFDIEAVHRAIARIEHVQGWRREKKGRYKVLESGEVGLVNDTTKGRQPGQRQRDKENLSGEKSAQRIAIEEAASIIARAKTWEQLHEELAAVGMRYVKIGSGAKIFVGDIGVKASTADCNASLPRLEKRLGKYRPPAPETEKKANENEREAEPLKPDVDGWKEYTRRRKAYNNNKHSSKFSLDSRLDAEWKQLLARQKARRTELFVGSWKGRGAELNALRSVIAAEQAAEKAMMRERHKQERKQQRERYQAFPTFEEWLRMQDRPDLAEKWRRRETESCSIDGDSDELPRQRDIRAFNTKIVGRDVQYKQAGAIGVEFVAFVDHGRSIDVYTWRDTDTTLAALQLAAQKWGNFQVSGDPEYKLMCAKLAAQHGFKITNPELQEIIENERENIRQDRFNAAKPDVVQSPALDAAEVYMRHHNDIMQRQRGGNVDLDAIDVMIAIRMRVTGHSRSDIESAILQCAQSKRKNPISRDWANYAQSTMLYAFSESGDLQYERLRRFCKEWMDLEGRPTHQKTSNDNAESSNQFSDEPDDKSKPAQPDVERKFRL